MKIRNGFVSNSSSSSFLVFFPHEIKTKDELYKLMWNNKNEKSIQKRWKFIEPSDKKVINYNDFVRNYNSVNMTFNEFKDSATNNVFNDIKKQGSNNYLYALSIISSGWFDDNGNFFDDNGNLIGNTIDDIKNQIKNYKELEDILDNFNWDIKNADEIYNDMKQELDDMWMLENISNTIEEIENYVKKHKDMIFYSFRYADEDGAYFSIMEHGRIFGDLPVYVESHH